MFDKRIRAEALRTAAIRGRLQATRGADGSWRSARNWVDDYLNRRYRRDRKIRCQEIFDYATYDQPDSVRYLVGMGQPMDYEPPMTAPTIPRMVWGGQIRLMARALEVELDEIREVVERRALDRTVTTDAMGDFDTGTQGGVRFEVQGIVNGEARIVIEHVTRIHPSVAPDWPLPPNGVGAHRVIIEGSPRIEVTLEATDEGGNVASGGNATAVGRLVSAIDWLVAAEPGVYDALDIPLRSAVGKLSR